jgi:hypothetical protein
MYKIILVIIFLTVIVGGALYFDKNKKEETSNPYVDSLVEAKLYQNEDETWGYDIMIDGNTYVHQPTKPAVGGNVGFATEAEAQSVANLVVSKIKNNILPPSVTPEEIADLKVH